MLLRFCYGADTKRLHKEFHHFYTCVFLRQENRFVEYTTRGSRLDNNKDTACSVILFLCCVPMCASMCMCVHMCGGWRATLSCHSGAFPTPETTFLTGTWQIGEADWLPGEPQESSLPPLRQRSGHVAFSVGVLGIPTQALTFARQVPSISPTRLLLKNTLSDYSFRQWMVDGLCVRHTQVSLFLIFSPLSHLCFR